MAGSNGESIFQKPPSTVVIVGVVVVVLLLLGWLTYANFFAPKEHPLQFNGPKSPEQTFIEQMQKKSGGDWNKLTAEEQARLNQITRGFGRLAIQADKKQ